MVIKELINKNRVKVINQIDRPLIYLRIYLRKKNPRWNIPLVGFEALVKPTHCWVNNILESKLQLHI
jgi:hypothetical protein